MVSIGTGVLLLETHIIHTTKKTYMANQTTIFNTSVYINVDTISVTSCSMSVNAIHA